MQIETLKEMWESYLKDVVPPQASATQVKETKLAFYGGITSILSTLADMGRNMNRVESEKVIKAYLLEMRAFAEELRIRATGGSRN
jgi:hypothetical protein